ncbi:MAG: hypothetical protein NBV55_00080 [Polynucleobacter sp.]|nr:hypothetical protein [Polynucleobacter sp.]
MGLFDLVKGKPSYMGQLQFDLNVFQFYCERFKYDSFQDFWHASSPKSDGGVARLVDQLYACEADFPKDDLLHAQLAQTCLDIEKHWFNTYGISPESLTLFSNISLQASQAYEDHMQLEPAEQIEPNPEMRVDDCNRSFKKYEQRLAELGLPAFDDAIKIHYFMNDINENLSALFKYSGSVLRVLEQDSYMQDDDVSWGRWTLFRDTTGYTDIWIVRIEAGRAEVVKMVSKVDADSYSLDETPRGIQFDSEIFKAIDKTRITAFDNSEFNDPPPPYFQMLSMMKAMAAKNNAA